MKLLICYFLLSIYSAPAPEVKDIRLKFHQATTSEGMCKSLIKQLEPYNARNNPLFLGYKGGATMLMAKYVFNPISKFSYFKKGKNMLEEAIKADGINVELRFLRYSVQTNVPSFLGYSSEIKADEAFLRRNLAGVRDNELKKVITSYLKEKN